MKRIIIIVLALLCAIALVACKNDPEEPAQVVKETWEDDIWGVYEVQQGDARYQIYFDSDRIVVLNVWTKDLMTNQWPDAPVTYTGTIVDERHQHTTSESASLIEKVSMQRIRMTFATVSDPAFNSTLHTYDGTFDLKLVSGYKSNINSSGMLVKMNQSGSMVEFGICADSNEPITVLAGISGWTYTKKYL